MLYWKTAKQLYGSPRKCLMLGTYCVGMVSYDMTISRNDERKYAAYAYLPGLKKTATHFQRESEAKEAVFEAVADWIRKAGLLMPAVEALPA